MVLSSWQSHCESSPGSFDECRTQDQARRLRLWVCLYILRPPGLHPPSPFIIITQPESWYSFYRPTEGRRPSRPNWLANYIQRWFIGPQTVTHPGTNRFWCSATTLIETNTLPNRQQCYITAYVFYALNFKLGHFIAPWRTFQRYQIKT